MALVPPAPQLATLPEYPSFGDSVAFQFNGLIVVFIALGTIWALMEITGRLFRRGQQTAVLPPTSRLGTSPVANDGRLPGEIVAAIVAAVAAEVERPHRIAAIMPVELTADWAREGRREIFASHKTR
ncbi:OadG family transporter subunit [Opitutus terrae]|uniref:Sodium pump decarboxylase gamma subunit n=1 Tax=Opitutus terrae (strain DSM 11246 / JCM 15787 / PB90-1) TaxID=452637 RepID=B1ZTD8_OPITP|nr:OadG family transporter subunit [Opitutus terrae]ACB76592.1 sodium pump decarboxylase gamma subunit [Opitutus terrae PB90-1]